MECQKSFGVATLIVGSLYVILAVISIFMFGSAVESSVLGNVGDECSDENCPVESVVLRILFLIVIACHIPFIFFSGKEGVLIIIDEISRESISAALDMKIKAMEEDPQKIPLISMHGKSEIQFGKEIDQNDRNAREFKNMNKSSPNVF